MGIANEDRNSIFTSSYLIKLNGRPAEHGLFSFSIFSERILYPSYAAVPRLWNISGLGSFFAQAGLRGANSAFHAGKHTKSEERKKARQPMGARTPIEDKRDYETALTYFALIFFVTGFLGCSMPLTTREEGAGIGAVGGAAAGGLIGGRSAMRELARRLVVCSAWEGRFDWRSTSGAGNEARRAAPENGSAAEGDRSSAKRNRKTQRRRVLVQRAGEMISLLHESRRSQPRYLAENPLGTSERGFNV